MKIKRRNTYEIVIFIILLITPFVEMINSVALYANGGESIIGKIWRVVIYILLTLILLSNKINKKYLETGFVIFSLLLVVSSIKVSTYGMDIFIEALKLFLPIFLVLVLENISKNKLININLFDSIIYMYSWLIPITFILPRIFGMGYYQYGNTGYKGFNYQLNDINIIVICLYIYSLEKIYEKKSMSGFIICILNIVTLIMFSSKASIVMLITISMYYIIKYINNKNLIKKIFRLTFLAFIATIIILFIMPKVYDKILNYFNRLIEMYKYMVIANHQSFWEFMSTTRSSRLKNIGVLYNNNPNWLNHLFFGLSLNDIPNSEMDILDIFFKYGIVIAGFIAYFYLKRYIHFCRKKMFTTASIMLFVMLLYSTVAGHVLMSAYSGTFLAIVIMYVETLNKNEAKD